MFLSHTLVLILTHFHSPTLLSDISHSSPNDIKCQEIILQLYEELYRTNPEMRNSIILLPLNATVDRLKALKASFSKIFL